MAIVIWSYRGCPILQDVVGTFSPVRNRAYTVYVQEGDQCFTENHTNVEVQTSQGFFLYQWSKVH